MKLVFQIAVPPDNDLPKKAFIKKILLLSWDYLKEQSLVPKKINAYTCPEVLVRIVSCEEMRSLNSTYRHKDYPTNVLSFPFEAPRGLDSSFLGDIIICHKVLKNETQAQQKTLADHYTHLLIHGLLHLLGYDHIDEADAEQMESIEIQILALLNIANPYEENV